MSVNAYILINVSGPQTKSALGKIQKFKGVMSAHVVVGPYDVIAFVEGENHKEIGDLVFTKIRRVQGVTATTTCFAMEA
jgi:DNA-binding Lrp family transcriptional regulator